MRSSWARILPEAEWRELKEIDDALLWHDLETLLAEMQHGPMPDLHIKNRLFLPAV